MLTKIVNLKIEPCDIYIGRPSKWGNPFFIGKDGTRDEVIEKYKEWVHKQDYLMKDLLFLQGKKLGCWCKPLACHGDILLELLVNYKQYKVL